MINAMTSADLRQWAKHGQRPATSKLARPEERTRFGKVTVSLEAPAKQQDWLDGSRRAVAAP